MSRLIFGGLLAFVLLGLFVYGVVVALSYHCTAPCSLPDAFTAFLETIGSLVSAVVVSELSVTKPTDPPGTRLAAAGAAAGYSAGQQATVKVLASIYILVWLISGLALVVFGWARNSEVAPVIAAAKQWLGFAIAAAYAYFGINP